MSQLQKMKNVYFLGQKPVTETPAYVNHFDVCTIPYAVNLRAEHASPLKLYEYAAASKPIIATDFTAARDFGGHLDIVRNAEEFVAACERALQLDASSSSIIENRNFAAQNTWDKRVEQVSELIESFS
jgi:glycosyltransferase involved in cell wall biosynthesis